MHSTWFRRTFLRVFKFLQIKEGQFNFWGGPILQKVWVIWCPLLYFNFKIFMKPNSLSFIRFQWILHDEGIVFSESSNFYKQKRGSLISGGEGNIFQKVWFIWCPLLYFYFKNLMDPNSMSFITFQYILHDQGVASQTFGFSTN